MRSLAASQQRLKARRSEIIAQNDAYRLSIQRNFNALWPNVDNAARILRLINSLRSNISVIGGIAALLTVRSRKIIVIHLDSLALGVQDEDPVVRRWPFNPR